MKPKYSKLESEIESELKKVDFKLFDKKAEAYYKEFNENDDKFLSLAIKINHHQLFNDIAELYGEIKFSHIKTLANYKHFIKSKGEKEKWYSALLKYYFDNAAYRYYSYWELIGQLLNGYLNLGLGISEKTGKEKAFYFHTVKEFVSKKYDNIYLNQLFEIYDLSKIILNIRKSKTHKYNLTLVGQKSYNASVLFVDEMKMPKLFRSEKYSEEDIKKISEQLYNNSVESLKILMEFYDKGHKELNLFQNCKSLGGFNLTREEVMDILNKKNSNDDKIYSWELLEAYKNKLNKK